MNSTQLNSEVEHDTAGIGSVYTYYQHSSSPFQNSCIFLSFVETFFHLFFSSSSSSLNQSLQEFDPGDSVFDATEWTDLSDGFNGKWKKKVNTQNVQ